MYIDPADKFSHNATNIGIKHGFLCINICWTPRMVLKPELEGVKQMLVFQKTMFDRYYCIKSFCLLKTLETHFEKFIFVLL